MDRNTPGPWVRLLHCYSWRCLRDDVAAGLTVATVAAPQAMAYAALAGIPPIYGLYTAIVVTALGSLFGSSAHLINGPTNAISLVVFSTVATVGEGPADPRRIQLVALLAVMLAVALAMGREGFIVAGQAPEVIAWFAAFDIATYVDVEGGRA